MQRLCNALPARLILTGQLHRRLRRCSVHGTAMHTHLFVVRLWREELSESSDEWRGRIVAVETGEERAFRDPATLYDALLRILTHMDENRQPKGWDENPPIVPTADDATVDGG